MAASGARTASSTRSYSWRRRSSLWDHRRWKNDDQAPGAARDEETTESFSGWSVGGSTEEETKEGDIESLVAAEARGRKQARDDDVEEGWNRFVAEQSGELA